MEDEEDVDEADKYSGVGNMAENPSVRRDWIRTGANHCSTPGWKLGAGRENQRGFAGIIGSLLSRLNNEKRPCPI